MKLLISGVPGTGKTTLGEHFATHHSFIHTDMERDEFAPVRAFKKDEQAFLDTLHTSEKAIVTWGFGPFMQRYLIERMRESGFTLIWLDGDRIASFRAFMHREKHNDRAEFEYYGQMREIVSTEIIARLNPAIVNPFTAEGDFRPLESVAKEVLSKAI